MTLNRKNNFRQKRIQVNGYLVNVTYFCPSKLLNQSDPTTKFPRKEGDFTDNLIQTLEKGKYVLRYTVKPRI